MRIGLSLFIAIIFILSASITFALTSEQYQDRNMYMQPYDHNAYGPGLHSDSTGKPFQWQTRQGQTLPGFEKVDPNAFGLNKGMDQYGRPVIPVDPQQNNDIFNNW